MGLKEGENGAHREEERKDGKTEEEKDELGRQTSEAHLCGADDEEEEEDGKDPKNIDVGPQVSLKDQLEKDKDDESLRRWKEQLLGSVDLENVGETLDPEVKILGVSILSPGRPDIILPIPPVPNSKGAWFSLKEGSQYRLKFTFSVSNNIVCGLRYTNAVWKTGIKVQRKCLVPLVLRRNLMCMRWLRRQHHLVCLQGDHTRLEQGSRTMMESVTWKSTTLSIYEKNGYQRQAEINSCPSGDVRGQMFIKSDMHEMALR